MSKETVLKTRHVQKHDIEANWIKAGNSENPFIPLQGEIIVYDDRYIDDNDVEHIVADKIRYKIGDGVTNVNNLSFMNNDSAMISTTHAELKELRDSGSLIPGVFYRITDYICTTTQTDTQAMDHKFDIIVQALSNSTLSEIAKADYHYDAEGNADGYFETEEGGFRLKALYDIIEDETGESNNLETYKPADIFIEYGYKENADGDVVPALFKTDMDDFPDEPDYEDVFYYIGTYEFDGVVYDKWRKIDDDYPWESSSKKFVLTDVIVKDGEFDQEALNSHTVTQIVKVVKVANLLAWELKYCLDNDTTRFSWADTEGGKGVIYYMKDEHNNECPYDFKNIQFKRFMISNTEYEQISNLVGHYLAPEVDMKHYSADLNDYKWCYTFSWLNASSEIEDLSIVGNRIASDEGKILGTCNNIIRPFTRSRSGIVFLQWDLNNIVFLSEYDYDDGLFYGCYSNTFGLNCHDNTFNNKCNINTFNDDCSYNTFSDCCNNNTFSTGCDNNDFGNYCTDNILCGSCYRNILGAGSLRNVLHDNCREISLGINCENNEFGFNCARNTFSNACTSNVLGDSCLDNTFSIRCDKNILGVACKSNTLESRSTYNILGNTCINNSFGSLSNSNRLGDCCNNNTFSTGCDNNDFGNYCTDNIFGKHSSNNIFGNNCVSNLFVDSDGQTKDHVSNVCFANNCKYIRLVTDTSSTGYLKNVIISAGVSGSSSSPLELQVTPGAAPTVYEASGTTHVILD